MPDNREFRKRIRNRRQSQRITTSVVNLATSELPPSQQKKIGTFRKPFTVSTEDAARRGVPSANAFAGSTGIGFVTKSSGKLKTPRLDVARHEVAHLVGAGHRALRLGSRGEQSPRSGVELRASIRLNRPSQFAETVPSLKSKRSKLSRVQSQRRSTVTSSFKAKPGTLRAAHQSSSPKRRKEAQKLSNKMGFRLRKKGIDF